MSSYDQHGVKKLTPAKFIGTPEKRYEEQYDTELFQKYQWIHSCASLYDDFVCTGVSESKNVFSAIAAIAWMKQEMASNEMTQESITGCRFVIEW